MILHSSICWSHNRPNQFSEQMHANLRAELGTVIDDSRHSPCSPHGLIGTHNEDGGAAGVELDCVVVVGHDGVVEDHEGVVVGHEGVVGGHEDVVVGHEELAEGHEGLVGSQDGVVEGHEGVVVGHEGVVVSHEGVVLGHEGVVGSHEGVVGGHEGTVGSQDGVVEGHEGVVVGHEGVVGSQDGVVEGHEGAVTIGLTMYRNKGVLFVKTICFIYFLEVEELQLMANYMLHEVHPRKVHHMNVSKHYQLHHIDNIYDNL